MEHADSEPQVTQSTEAIVDRINVTLTNVPVALYRSWKAMAAMNDLSMKDAVLEALRMWVSAKSKEMEAHLQEGIQKESSHEVV